MAMEEDSIEQAVAERRERLKALKAAQELLNTPDEGSVDVEDKAEADIQGSVDKTDGDNETDKEGTLNIKFRNYLPHDTHLKEGKLAPPVLPKFEDPVVAVQPPKEKEDPFLSIAPKKQNWDLRRDAQKKLDKLERRTQKAIYQLTQEEEKKRLAEESTMDTEDQEGDIHDPSE